MDKPSIVVPPREDPVSPGRSFSLKLRGGETGDSIMMFEETVPAGTKSTFHLHHDSDEVAYVLSGEVTFKVAPRGQVLQCDIPPGSPAGPACSADRDHLERAEQLAMEPGRFR